MIALSKKMLEQEPGEIELLLPWYAAGTLNARDMCRVEEALAHDPVLARQYAEIQGEYAETIALNESLGAPSMQAMHRLFAAIDMDPTQSAAASRGPGARVLRFFDSLSPRALAWSASFGALLVLLQAGMIGTVLMTNQTATYQAVPLGINDRAVSDLAMDKRAMRAPAAAAPLTRSLGLQEPNPAHVLVRFAPDARVADITALLDDYQASIIDGGKGGTFLLQVGDKAMSKDEADNLLGRLRREKIVRLAATAP
jgi:hypothetical protein